MSKVKFHKNSFTTLTLLHAYKLKEHPVPT